MARNVVFDIIGRDKASAAFSKVAASADTLTKKLNSAGKKMTKVGKNMTRVITLPVLAAGGAATKLATDFEHSMSLIQGLVGASQSQIDTWSKQIIALGPKVAKSPQELADALYFITSSGIPASQAMSVLTVSARAAAAGLGDTTTIADAVTSAMNAYGSQNLSAARATDILAAAVREGKGEPEELAAAMGRVIAPAQALGVSFDQVSAAMASMTLVGLDANEAATSLRGILMALQNPTHEQVKALESMGLSLAQVRDVVAKQGLLPALQMLAEKTHGNVETASALFGNVRALNGVLIMTGKNADKTAKVFDGVKNSTGSVNTAFDTASKTAKFKFDASLSKLKGSAIKLGNKLIPVLTKVADFVSKAADAFSNLSPAMQNTILIVVAIVAAIGPLLTILGSLATAIGAVGAVLAFLAANPVVLIIAAIVALVAGLVLAYQHFQGFRDVVDAVGRFVMNAFTRMQEVVGGALRSIISFLVGLPGRILGAVSRLPGLLVSTGHALITGLLNAAKSAWHTAIAWLGDLGSSALNALGDWGSLLVSVGKRVMQGLWNGMKSIWNKATSWLSSLNPANWFNDINPYKGHAIKNLEPVGRAVFQGLQNGMQSQWMTTTRWLRTLNPSAHIGVGSTSPMGTGGRAFAGSPTNATIVVPITAEIDGAVLAKKTVTYTSNELRKYGERIA